MSINFNDDQVELLEEFSERFDDNRAEAAREALQFYIQIDKVLGGVSWWIEMDARQRRLAVHHMAVLFRNDDEDAAP